MFTVIPGGQQSLIVIGYFQGSRGPADRPRQELCPQLRTRFAGTETGLNTCCMFKFSNNTDFKIKGLLVGPPLPPKGWVWVLGTVGLMRDLALWEDITFLPQQILRNSSFCALWFEGSLHGAGTG